jgi:site-specific recombinase XerD
MTALRERLISELHLRGYADRTIETYVGVVRQVAQHFHRPPDQLTDDELRAYILHLSGEKHLAPASVNLGLSGLKFFYRHVLGRGETVLEIARPKHGRRLPVVLTNAEVWQILSSVRVGTYRTCLTLIYACGLRLMEAIRMQVGDIDGQRLVLHVRGGKGGKDRYVPLPAPVLDLLRAEWRSHRNSMWLFPRPLRSGDRHAFRRDPAIGCMHPTTLQRAFGIAVKASGTTKRAHIHTLRHSYATHLLEAGVPVAVIQEYLGHSALGTTAMYMHVTRDLRAASRDPINALIPQK